MAKHPAKCPKCGGPLEYESAADEKIVCPACQALLSVPGKVKASDRADPLLGQSLGEFEIVELLGRGGMGAVYKARQPSLDRFVAVKVLPRSLSRDASFIERFNREARAAAAVAHPNIIQVHTVGQDGGFQFIAMELVEGESLADVLKREGPLPPERALGLFREVASALAKAHASGVVHRDIKPSNILLTSDGHAKVADFGLAKRADVDVSVTQTGAMMGTPLYFPPEAGRGERYDARSDLYSLGATFYHLIAGRPPFEGNSATALAIKHANDPVPPLKQAAPDAPAALCSIIHRLLQKKAEDRFPSAAELLDALNRVPVGGASLPRVGPDGTRPLPEGARGALAERPQARKARQRRLILIASASATVLVVVLVLVLRPGPRPQATHVAPPPSPVSSVSATPKTDNRQPTTALPAPPPPRKVEPPAKTEPAPKKEEPPEPEPRKEEPPKPEPKTTAKEAEDAGKAAEEERQREAEAARRDALARAEAAYAVESDKVWALFNDRKYDEADKLLAALAGGASLPRERVLADQEASKLLKDFWPAVAAGLATTKGKFLIVARAAGNLEEVKDGVIRIRTAKGEIEERPLTQLAGKQALHYFRLSDRVAQPPPAVPEKTQPRAAVPHAELMAGVFLLAEATALDEVAAALDKAGDEPFVAVYKERLNALQMGAAEAAAQKAWLSIQDEAKGKITPASGKRLSDLLAAFEKQHGATKLHKGLAEDLAELKTRIEDSLCYTQWPFDGAEAKRRQTTTADALGVKVEQEIDLGNGVKMTFVLIPAGEFLVGSPPTTSPEKLATAYGGKPEDYEGEFPQHRVKISRPFWMAKTEVTLEQYMAILQTNPSQLKDKPKNPVQNVDWNQASGFAKELSEKLKKTFRLPTEAEWEYACRAGTATEFYFGNDAAKLGDFGWVGSGAQPVGMKKLNAWGLCDMAGNVVEWCEDWFGKYVSGAQTDPKGAPAGVRRVMRGGSWYHNPGSLRSAHRGAVAPGFHAGIDSLGFRVVLVQQGSAIPTPAPAPPPVAVGPSKVYTEWPFDAAEAKRRQKATAETLGVKVEQDIDLGKGVKMTFLLIPAGEFLMGSPPTTSPEKLAGAYGGDPKEYEGEFPQHRVKISRPFWIAKHEVTQEQWMAALRTNPSRNKDKPKNPVENVTWEQIHAFPQMLCGKFGKTFRLPTEAEWEYACRAGAATEFYFGNDPTKVADFGWVGSTNSVGMKKPNAWGLCDMAGNVSEYCEDWYGKYDSAAQTDPKGPPKGPPAGRSRMLRGGGSGYTGLRALRSAWRVMAWGGADGGYGFRVVLVPEPR